MPARGPSPRPSTGVNGRTNNATDSHLALDSEGQATAERDELAARRDHNRVRDRRLPGQVPHRTLYARVLEFNGREGDRS
jgi:hypothetical protein